MYTILYPDLDSRLHRPRVISTAHVAAHILEDASARISSAAPDAPGVPAAVRHHGAAAPDSYIVPVHAAPALPWRVRVWQALTGIAIGAETR
jgi:hypothetical protein